MPARLDERRPRSRLGQSRRPEIAFLRCDPCAYCGGPGGAIDHIVPGRGGTHGADNLTGACQRCNEAKGRWPLLAFLLLSA